MQAVPEAGLTISDAPPEGNIKAMYCLRTITERTRKHSKKPLPGNFLRQGLSSWFDWIQADSSAAQSQCTTTRVRPPKVQVKRVRGHSPEVTSSTAVG